MSMSDKNQARVDFHLHSHASNVTDYYAANALSIAESYSDPKALYRLLRERGMDLVTLTDHNSIEGVKELLDAGLPDVFISSEITCTFPEDGCNIHVTVANVTEAQFKDVMRLRANVYEMIAYLDREMAFEVTEARENRIVYFMTHPLMSTQNRPYGRDGSLKPEHIERMLVLCNTFEVQNGGRTRALNDLTRQLLISLDRPLIERLADKHGLVPKGPTPWLKGLTGGSDDHGGINPGFTWTAFSLAEGGPTSGSRPTPNDLVDAIRARRTDAGGNHGGPITLAHSIFKILHEGTERAVARGESGGAVAVSGPTQSLLQLVFSNDESRIERLRFQARATFHALGTRLLPSRWRKPPRTFEQVLTCQVYALLGDAAFRETLARTQGTDERIFLVLNTLLNGIFATYFDHLRSASGGNVVETIKGVVALVTSNLCVSAPYLAAFLAQASDSLVARDVRRTFRLDAPSRLVLVTDTFFEINGVSGTIKRMLRESVRRGISLTVVTVLGAHEQDERLQHPEVAAWIRDGRLKVFTAIRTVDLPHYQDLKVQFAPLLEMLRYLQEQGFTKMQISTPGMVGLTGLLAAKVLQIETAATYHTSVPEYVENYTQDIALEAMAWRYMILFYHAMDEVIVPSKYIARLLHKRGLRKRKLLVLDRWVDVERFDPRKRREDYWARFGIENGTSLVKFIYVGRIGREKNLELLAQAFRELATQHRQVHLFLVGDGPYRQELQSLCADLPATFTGFLEGEDLAVAIASADVKLFPSTTDTWGNAPLEAQASGLPVIVSSVGGPCELMQENHTGFVVTGRDVGGLVKAMEALLDLELRAEMGRNARDFTVRNRVTQPFCAILDSEAYRASLAEGEHPSRAVIEVPLPPVADNATVLASDWSLG